MSIPGSGSLKIRLFKNRLSIKPLKSFEMQGSFFLSVPGEGVLKLKIRSCDEVLGILRERDEFNIKRLESICTGDATCRCLMLDLWGVPTTGSTQYWNLGTRGRQGGSPGSLKGHAALDLAS